MNSRSLLLTLAIPILIIIVIGFLLFASKDTSSIPHVTFTPQHTKLFTIDNPSDTPIPVLATTLPEFAFTLADQKFTHLWEAQVAERNALVESSVVNAKGDTDLAVQTQFNDSLKELILTPKTANQMKPGLYTLQVKIKTLQGQDSTMTQHFTWGVLAINTNKSVYTPGEQVNIGMAVLDDFGTTKCIAKGPVVFGTAKVHLAITSPSGQTTAFSTDDNTIIGSKECGDRTVTNTPDFQAKMMTGEVGKYTMHMEAETFLGKNSIDDVFVVKNNVPAFDIERVVYPTRIYPRADYPVTVTVTAHQDYSGVIYDVAPGSFIISQISDSGRITMRNSFQTIEWQVNWKNGETHSLSYTIHFPPIAPEFYLTGPFTIGQFKEDREWQIASDSLFSKIQEVHNTTADAGGKNITVAFSSPAVSGHLIVLICARPTNTSFSNAPTNNDAGQNIWSKIYAIKSTPTLYVWYKITPSVGFSSVTCTSNSSTGGLTAQLLEFSGNSTSGVLDKFATAVNNTTCNATIASNSVTPTNPDDLLVSAFASNTPSLTASGHRTITGAGSSGFADTATNGYSNANVSTDTGWGEAVNNPATAQFDNVTFSANGKCSAGVAAFNATITISQGSFRFFNNADSLTPGTTLAAQNTNITLTQANQQFRLRMLLDVDSTSSLTLGLQSGDFLLEYATISGTLTCSTASYDVVSTPLSKSEIAFNPNPSIASSGQNITSSGSDPADTPTYATVLESYYQDDTSAPGPAGGANPGDITNDQNSLTNAQAGLWDFSLVDNSDQSSQKTYCIKMTNGDGSNLNAYNNIPKVTTIKNDVDIRGGTVIQGGTKLQ